MQVLTDPADCGPVTLALCQDVQAEAYDYPESFFAERVWAAPARRTCTTEARRGCALKEGQKAGDHRRRRRALFQAPRALPLCRGARHPGDGDARPASRVAAARPSAQHGLGRRHRHVGRQPLAEEADVVLAVGTRLQDFTTGSWALFKAEGGKTIIGLNVQAFDAGKHRALPLVADAREGSKELEKALGGWKRRRAGPATRAPAKPLGCGARR
jgi:3D-(3,5/4)-trihydroxycyclohexane-1,2-dione acylhydrolase (decyclizing)